MISITINGGSKETEEQALKRILSIPKKHWYFSPYSIQVAYIIMDRDKMAALTDYIDNPESRENIEITYFEGHDIIKDVKYKKPI